MPKAALTETTYLYHRDGPLRGKVKRKNVEHLQAGFGTARSRRRSQAKRRRRRTRKMKGLVN